MPISYPTSHLFYSFLILSTTPILLLLLLLLHVPLQWRRPDNRLPPGSMGWPYNGETLRLYTCNPNSFFSSRQKRYGEIFKTHILGCPCVMITSPKAAKVVLMTKAHLFKPTYPPSKELLIGPHALFFHQGHYHFRLKKLLLSSFLPSSLTTYVSEIDHIIQAFLPTWENQPSINTLQEMKNYAFEVAMMAVFGGRRGEVEVEKIKHLHQCLEKGYNSMPLNLPGTPFHKSIKARKLLNEMLKKLISKRRANNEFEGDLLGVLLNLTHQKPQQDCNLNYAQIADNIIGVIFAAHGTTASVMTWVIKYLYENQDLLETVTGIMEQEAIRKRLDADGRSLVWEDTKSMPLTSRVIQGTLRRESILSFTFREAVEDVEFEGYIVPKGWKVLPLFRSIHHSPKFFLQPEKIDPSRFEVLPGENMYMPFGKELHSCPGSELAKLEMLVLLHNLTTSFRWKVIGEDEGIQYGPFPVPKHGLPISVQSRNAHMPDSSEQTLREALSTVKTEELVEVFPGFKGKPIEPQKYHIHKLDVYTHIMSI